MDTSGNLIANIEDAIINTFFEAEGMGIHHDKLFILDEKNFTTHFKKKIVNVINECIQKDKTITLQAMSIADKCKGTQYEYDVLNILSQNPLTIKMAKDYHSYLAEKRIEREIRKNAWA